MTVAVLFSLLLVEAGLRIYGYSNPFYYNYDDVLGTSLRPGSEGLYQKEGKAYIKINSDGLRDIEHEIKKQPGVYRIAILGDSYAEGLQVDMDKLFWKVLEKKLDSCSMLSHQKVEVINFGVSGYGTGRELLMLREKVWKYEPDLVLLAFLTDNDIRDNSKILNEINYIPYFYKKGSSLVLDKSYLESPRYKGRDRLSMKIVHLLGNHIRLIQLLNDVRHAWQLKVVKESASDVDTAAKKNSSNSEIGLDNFVYMPPINDVWKKAWAVTEALLLQMKKEVEVKGADFLVVTLSNGAQVGLDVVVKKDFIKSLNVSDLYYPDYRVRDFSNKHAIQILTLAPKLAEIAEREHIYMHGFENTVMGQGHWNENAHQLAGEYIAEKICKLRK